VWATDDTCNWEEHPFTTPCEGWYWWCDREALYECSQVHKEIYSYGDKLSGEFPGIYDNCRSASSDALYIPATRSKQYFAYTEVFLDHRTFNEVAVPNIARLLNTPEYPNVEWMFQFGLDANSVDHKKRNGGVCGKDNLFEFDLAHAMNFHEPWDIGHYKELIAEGVSYFKVPEAS
jgi:hypothetical protein